MGDNVNRDRHRERRSAPAPKREPVDMSARRNDHDRAPHQERRQPSTIEPREWRGAGVCGDRHTD